MFVYDIIPKKKKDFWLKDDNKHNENFIIIIMKVSDKYKSGIFPWKSNKQQKDLMLNTKFNGK